MPVAEATRPEPLEAATTPPSPFRVRRRDAALLGLATAIAIAALIVARLGVHGPPEAFTQLWLQGGTRGAPLAIGVESHEAATVGYHLDLLIDGQVRRSTEFDLAPGAQKVLAAPKVSPGSTLEARLALQSKPNQVYRRVLLHVPIPTPTPRPTRSG